MTTIALIILFTALLIGLGAMLEKSQDGEADEPETPGEKCPLCESEICKCGCPLRKMP